MLYKYYTKERVDYFKNALVRFTQPEFLNDPFECYPSMSKEAIDIILVEELKKVDHRSIANARGESREKRRELERVVKKAGQKKYREMKSDPAMTRDFYKSAVDDFFKDIGIFSLSKRWDSPLMWAHYADKHTGFCIGFNKNHEFFENFQPGLGIDRINEVNYSKQRPSIDINAKGGMQSPNLKNIELLCTKSIDWEYEKECRMVLITPPRNKLDKNVYLHKIPHEAVSEIILGLKASKHLQGEVLNFCREKSINLYKTIQHDTEYKFSRKLLSL